MRPDPDYHAPPIPEPGTAEAIRAAARHDEALDYDDFYENLVGIRVGLILRAIHDGVGLRSWLLGQCVELIGAEAVEEALNG